MRAEHLIVVGEKQTPVLQVRQEAWSFTSWPVFSFFEKKHMYFLFFQNVLSIWQNLQSILCKPHIWLTGARKKGAKVVPSAGIYEQLECANPEAQNRDDTV